MFPYPSGRLHMGHVRNYTIGDVLSRYMRMQGLNVLQPMGWDAFGLPAENAAISNNVPPATVDARRTSPTCAAAAGAGFCASTGGARSRPAIRATTAGTSGCSCACSSSGIAYRKTGIVNWDPVDQTVLANEQVIDGRGWRTGALIEKREIPMYYLNITRYADELLEALDALGGWPERVRVMQANWIGRSEGCEVAFPYATDTRAAARQRRRAEGIHHARGHALWRDLPRDRGGTPDCARRGTQDPRLAAFIEECRRGSVMEADVATQDKKGMATGLHVLHPLTGESLPVWVANYVLMGYGEGAVMGVPAHDERDFEFATRNQLPIVTVVRRHGWRLLRGAGAVAGGLRQYGVTVNSGEFSGLPSRRRWMPSPRRSSSGAWAKKRVQYRLRDWGISRQRYWGCPIPLIHCERCGVVPVPDEDLPVRPAGGPGARWQRQPARQVAGLLPVHLSRSAAGRRAARPTPWTPSWIRPGTSCATPAPTTRRRWSMSASTTGCRSTSTSAASSTRSCTSCMRASGPR